RKLPGLQAVPVSHELLPVELRPRFDEPLLAPRQRTGDHVDRVDAEDGHVVLMVRMEVRAMMRAANLDEHADDDAEEPRQLRHVSSYFFRNMTLQGDVASTRPAGGNGFSLGPGPRRHSS